MEKQRKVGEKFTSKGIDYIVCECVEKGYCEGCSFDHSSDGIGCVREVDEEEITGNCSGCCEDDEEDPVIFKNVELEGVFNSEMFKQYYSEWTKDDHLKTWFTIFYNMGRFASKNKITQCDIIK